MKFDIYKINAFSEKLFKGNPAAVIPLEQWLPDNLMQNIAYGKAGATEEEIIESAKVGSVSNGECLQLWSDH